jgi:hypothetical protein
MRRTPLTAPVPKIACGIVAVLLLTIGCNVERTQEARAPDVDVDPGQWPKYDVKWADVDVGTTERTITVPKLEVRREQETVQVPYIDINVPGAGDRAERTVTVELEVPSSGYDVEIKEIRAAGDELWVISELQKRAGQPAAQAITRVDDRVVIRSPEDLDVRKIVIGSRPEGVYNQQYTFVENRSALEERIPAGGRVIYQRGS